jgi:hypothetical protein
MTIPAPVPNSELPALTETIWQFMPLPALLSVLQKSQLFFRRLAGLEDPNEGKFPQIVLDSLNHSFHQSGTDQGADPWTAERVEASGRENWFVNCWHLNSVASPNMWEQYARSDGVAIRSTVGSLLKAWKAAEYRITMNGVRYRDQAATLTEVFPPFHKTVNFQLEKEFRAVLVVPSSGRHLVRHGGVYVSVDLDTLIEDIHLSPSMPLWVSEVVTVAVRERLGMECVPATEPPLHTGLDVKR